MGQLPAQLFQGQEFLIPSLSNLQEADFKKKKVQSSFQACYLRLEPVAVNSQHDIQRTVLSKATIFTGVTTEGWPQGVNRWWASKTGRPG